MSEDEEWVGDDQGTSNASTGLAVLWDEICLARAAMASQRAGSNGHASGKPWAELVQALDSYLGLIAAKGYPAPYALVSELSMLRRIGPGSR